LNEIQYRMSLVQKVFFTKVPEECIPLW